jgi:hypothetical protein
MNPARAIHRHARTFSLLLAISSFFTAAALAVSAYPSQAPHSSSQRFSGNWNAVFQEKTIIVLRPQAEDEHPSGTIQLAGFQLDLEGDGSIMTVTDGQLDKPIDLKNIKRGGKILSFDFVDSDGDNDKFQMELTANNSAKLQWVGLPNGLKALPIPVTRQPAKSPKTN